MTHLAKVGCYSVIVFGAVIRNIGQNRAITLLPRTWHPVFVSFWTQAQESVLLHAAYQTHNNY